MISISSLKEKPITVVLHRYSADCMICHEPSAGAILFCCGRDDLCHKCCAKIKQCPLCNSLNFKHACLDRVVYHCNRKMEWAVRELGLMYLLGSGVRANPMRSVYLLSMMPKDITSLLACGVASCQLLDSEYCRSWVNSFLTPGSNTFNVPLSYLTMWHFTSRNSFSAIDVSRRFYSNIFKDEDVVLDRFSGLSSLLGLWIELKTWCIDTNSWTILFDSSDMRTDKYFYLRRWIDVLINRHQDFDALGLGGVARLLFSLSLCFVRSYYHRHSLANYMAEMGHSMIDCPHLFPSNEFERIKTTFLKAMTNYDSMGWVGKADGVSDIDFLCSICIRGCYHVPLFRTAYSTSLQMTDRIPGRERSMAFVHRYQLFLGVPVSRGGRYRRTCSEWHESLSECFAEALDRAFDYVNPFSIFTPVTPKHIAEEQVEVEQALNFLKKPNACKATTVSACGLDIHTVSKNLCPGKRCVNHILEDGFFQSVIDVMDGDVKVCDYSGCITSSMFSSLISSSSYMLYSEHGVVNGSVKKYPLSITSSGLEFWQDDRDESVASGSDDEDDGDDDVEIDVPEDVIGDDNNNLLMAEPTL